jgi:hypothetical protein
MSGARIDPSLTAPGWVDIGTFWGKLAMFALSLPQRTVRLLFEIGSHIL